jgi:hypothetical protein
VEYVNWEQQGQALTHHPGAWLIGAVQFTHLIDGSLMTSPMFALTRMKWSPYEMAMQEDYD